MWPTCDARVDHHAGQWTDRWLGHVPCNVRKEHVHLCLVQIGVALLGFATAMLFHMANLVLWRINFFVAWCPALLVLVAPGESISLWEIWQAGRSKQQ